MTILQSIISIWKHHSVGTPCNPIHSTDSHSPLKVQGCPIVAFAEFKVITVVMTGILFCLRPPCSAPGIGSTTDSASWDLPEVLRCSRSAERSAQCAAVRKLPGKTEARQSGVVVY